jgi:hypothetical protein
MSRDHGQVSDLWLRRRDGPESGLIQHAPRAVTPVAADEGGVGESGGVVLAVHAAQVGWLGEGAVDDGRVGASKGPCPAEA